MVAALLLLSSAAVEAQQVGDEQPDEIISVNSRVAHLSVAVSSITRPAPAGLRWEVRHDARTVDNLTVDAPGDSNPLSLVKKDFIRFETAGNKHWLGRSKSNTRWASIERLGKDDELVVLEVDEPGYPTTWELRAIHYKRKGFPRATLLTSLLDPVQYPANELVALYHERWETELGYDEVKTHLLDREEAIRSRTPDGVRQELWGIAIAYNLIRLEMERAAAEAKVAPTRISFMAAMALIKDEIGRLRGASLPLGTIPDRLKDLRKNLKRLVLPERRSERAYPRAVKIKMSNYARKRPKPRRSPTGGRTK